MDENERMTLFEDTEDIKDFNLETEEPEERAGTATTDNEVTETTEDEASERVAETDVPANSANPENEETTPLPLRTIILREARSWLILIVITVGAALLLTRFVIVNAHIPTASMEPAIMSNDRVIANRLAYSQFGRHRADPERYHVVVFRFPGDTTQLYVKRVMGLPGETVTIINGRVYITSADRTENEEPYRARDDFINSPLFGDFGPFVVPEGHFFMLGDYRMISEDSRMWPEPYRFVSHDLLLGRVIFRYFRIPGMIR